jgi:NAD(P)-dependent dehydrogenase (short-subunit alcohol dehydrogenase family)
MHDKRVALVTGANKGIGLQIAKDLAAHGFTVLVGSRNLDQGETAAKGIEGDARALHLMSRSRSPSPRRQSVFVARSAVSTCW